MTVQAKFLACAVAMSGFVAFAAVSPANALSMSECSAKYKEAKTAGTLNGQKWNDFRKAECGADATATPAAAPAAAPAAPPPAAEAKPARAPKPVAAAPAAPAAPEAVGNAVFPNAVDPKYSSLSAGKGRFKTCDDQYRANKATNGNGGLKWIMKGGGYYSECNKKLKGA
jgi:hypothetical protein